MTKNQLITLVGASIGAVGVIVASIIMTTGGGSSPEKSTVANATDEATAAVGSTVGSAERDGVSVVIADSDVSSHAEGDGTAVSAINSNVEINKDRSEEKARAALRSMWDADLPRTTALISRYPGNEADFDNAALIRGAVKELEDIQSSMETVGSTELALVFAEAHEALIEIDRVCKATVRLLQLGLAAEKGELSRRTFEEQAAPLREQIHPTTRLLEAYRTIAVRQMRIRKAIARTLSQEDPLPDDSRVQELQELFGMIPELSMQGKDREAKAKIQRAIEVSRGLFTSGGYMGREAFVTALTLRAADRDSSGDVPGAIADLDTAIGLARELLNESSEDTNVLRLSAYLAERAGLHLKQDAREAARADNREAMQLFGQVDSEMHRAPPVRHLLERLQDQERILN